MSLVFSLKALDTSHVSTQVLHGERRVLFLEASDKLVQISVEPVYLGCAGKSLGAYLDLILQLSPCGSGKNNREIKFDVTWSYVKQQTAKMKLFPSVLSSLNSRVKIFVFVANSRRHFSIFM